MIRKGVLFVTIAVLWAHDPESDSPHWKTYLRGGLVNIDQNSLGLATYFRIKRTTNYTFGDVRLYAHIFETDQDIHVRYKSSRIPIRLPWLYNFTTVSYQRNTLVDVKLRYHYNQGLGWFIRKTDSGNMTAEMGIAYDMSDYLEDTRKTTYLKSAFTYDKSVRNIDAKLELDYFYQISDEVNEKNQSRFQILGELYWNIYQNLKLIGGMYQELPSDKSYNEQRVLLYFTLGFNKPLEWNY